MRSRNWGLGLSVGAAVLALAAISTVLSPGEGGWGPNDRAWFDDVFWMELATQGLSAGVAAAVAIGLYRRGQRNERRKAEVERAEERRQEEAQRREEIASELMDVLLDLEPHVLAQTNEPEPIPDALTSIHDLAAHLSRMGSRLVGTTYAGLPLQLGRQITTWAVMAIWSAKRSPNRPPDLIEHAVQLDEYIVNAREQIGRWRNGQDIALPAAPQWVIDRQGRAGEAALLREDRRARTQGVADQ
jgi:hypothetical protein